MGGVPRITSGDRTFFTPLYVPRVSMSKRPFAFSTVSA
jgi:hypothetical protein